MRVCVIELQIRNDGLLGTWVVFDLWDILDGDVFDGVLENQRYLVSLNVD